MRTAGANQSSRPAWPRYLIIGLVVGGLWISHGDEPLWEHAARTLVILLIVPPLIHLVRERVQARRGHKAHPSGRRLSIPRLVAFKTSLLMLGLSIEWLIQGRVPHSDLIVAVFLTVSVALLGVMLNSFFMVPVKHREPT